MFLHIVGEMGNRGEGKVIADLGDGKLRITEPAHDFLHGIVRYPVGCRAVAYLLANLEQVGAGNEQLLAVVRHRTVFPAMFLHQLQEAVEMQIGRGVQGELMKLPGVDAPHVIHEDLQQVPHQVVLERMLRAHAHPDIVKIFLHQGILPFQERKDRVHLDIGESQRGPLRIRVELQHERTGDDEIIGIEIGRVLNLLDIGTHLPKHQAAFLSHHPLPGKIETHASPLAKQMHHGLPQKNVGKDAIGPYVLK